MVFSQLRRALKAVYTVIDKPFFNNAGGVYEREYINEQIFEEVFTNLHIFNVSVQRTGFLVSESNRFVP